MSTRRKRASITLLTNIEYQEHDVTPDRIANRTPQASTDIGFITSTELAYKVLSVTNAIPGSNTAEILIESYGNLLRKSSSNWSSTARESRREPLRYV